MKKIHSYFFVLSTLASLLFMSLGIRQCQLEKEKSRMLQTITTRQHTLLNSAEYFKKNNNHEDISYYQIRLHGFFDNTHHLFLDKKIQNQSNGYHVFTPFYDRDSQTTFLIDRGFLPVKEKTYLPSPNQLIGTMFIRGVLIPPEPSSHLEKTIGSHLTQWPLRLNAIHIEELSHLLHTPIAPHFVKLAPNDPLGYDTYEHFNSPLHEEHARYALQWFALAITVVVLSVAFYKKGMARRLNLSANDDKKG